MWFMADRCNVPTNSSLVPPPFGGGEGEGGHGEHAAEEVCDLKCKILAGLFGLIFVIAVIAGVIFVCHRYVKINYLKINTSNFIYKNV